jgi:hypothetical protein
VYDKDSIDAGVEMMKTNPACGLVVLLNRYDGVDLPGDACHILVIDGLPEALDAIDRLDEQQLTGSDSLLAMQVQRIEQGMGRAVAATTTTASCCCSGTGLRTGSTDLAHERCSPPRRARSFS